MMKLLPFFVLLLALSAYPQTATVIPENANLRGTPSVSGKVVETIPQNLVVEVLQQRGAWFLVQTTDYAGWVHGNSLRLIGTLQTVTLLSPPSMPAKPSGPVPVYSGTEPTPATTVPLSSTLSTPSGRILKGICGDGTRIYVEDRFTACAQHGYLKTWLDEAEPIYNARTGTSAVESTDVSAEPSGSSTSPPSSSGTVHVNGYYRKDGTYVRPYTRSAPRRRP
jgi:hypothetical protein